VRGGRSWGVGAVSEDNKAAAAVDTYLMGSTLLK
jgi:hypothetical protein